MFGFYIVNFFLIGEAAKTAARGPGRGGHFSELLIIYRPMPSADIELSVVSVDTDTWKYR